MQEKTRSIPVLRIVVRPAGPRVVLDTNLFVAAYWNPRSASARILAAGEAGELRVLYSPAIVHELRLILRNARTSAAFQARVTALLAEAMEVHPTQNPRRVPEDPDDDKFLSCALAGDAEYLISSDAHLLRLDAMDGVRIIPPGRFVRAVLDAAAADEH